MGMLIVGTLIGGALETNNAFTIILGGTGGIGVIGYYYSKFWKHGE